MSNQKNDEGKSKSSSPQVVQLGKHKIPTRITTKRIRRVKELTGIDLTGDDTENVVAFQRDPITVSEVCFALYSDHFEKAGIDEDQFDDLCGPAEITALRQEVTEQMKSFSPFWTMICTYLEDVLAGNTSLQELADLAKTVPSGPSS